MCTYHTSVYTKVTCVHNVHTLYGKCPYVYMKHITVMEKVVMCTYCTKLFWRRLCVHAAHTLYGKSYVHILHELVNEKVMRTSVHTHYAKVMHMMNILVMSNVTYTYRTYSLCHKLCVRTARENG
jgi:hypothetical protein